MKNSDHNTFFTKSTSRVGLLAALIVALATSAFAQEPYHFIEGSVHSFSVAYHEGNSYAWGMYYNPYNQDQMEPETYDLMGTGESNELTIRFNDAGRTVSELVYLVVTETGQNGCSTRRALEIMLEPNNMYFDFAEFTAPPEMIESAECYNGEDYYAAVEVGMNFYDSIRGTGQDAPIPADRFPLSVTFSVQNITEGTAKVEKTVDLEYSSDGQYFLVIDDAKGSDIETTTYELAINDVIDKYNTKITHDDNRRVQIRVINHLPNHSTRMEMALAYAEIKYIGERN